MISVTITDRSGRTLSGQTIDAFWISIAHARPFSRRHQLRARRARHAAVPRRAGAASPTATSAAIRTPACRTRSASTTSSPTKPRALLARVRRERLGQHRRRLLRHDARSHRGDRRGGRSGAAAAQADRRTAATSVRRLRVVLTQFCRASSRSTHPPRQQLPDDRRAHQRHRLDAVRAADQGGRLRRRRRDVAREQVRGGANIIDVNMDEGMLDSEQAMTDVPELHRHRARDRARADHDRQLEVVGHRGRAEVRAGQGDRQLDQPEGRRGGVPAQGARSSGATAPASS